MTKPCAFCNRQAKEYDWPMDDIATTVCDPCAAQRADLIEAYGAINWAEFKHKIGRDERNKRIVALRSHPQAAGLTFEQRDVLALFRAVQLYDEMNTLGASWQ